MPANNAEPRLVAMTAHKPRSLSPAGGDGRRVSSPGKSGVVRVSAPANDNGPSYARAARWLVRLAAVLAVIGVLAALIR
ncbi:MAG TPA: hypothetical protein VJR58_03535 [Vineibacter sp.]|nr:hypothetical protein [Vineibacter sp.]